MQVLLQPRPSWTQTVLGQAIREFQAEGWKTDRIPRVISDSAMGFDVHLEKARVLVTADSKRREVNLCLRSGKDILKLGRVDKPNGIAIVGAVVEFLREASV